MVQAAPLRLCWNEAEYVCSALKWWRFFDQDNVDEVALSRPSRCHGVGNFVPSGRVPGIVNASHRLTARRATGPFTRIRLVWRDAAALLLSLPNPRLSTQSRLIALAALLYLVSPVDLLPDGLPLLGFGDDLLVVPALLAFAVRSLPAPVLQDSRRKLDRLKLGRLSIVHKVALCSAVLALVALLILPLAWQLWR